MATQENSAKVILKKKEVRSKNDLAVGPLGLSSRQDAPAVLPPLSPSAKVEDEVPSCRESRREIMESRPEIELDTISYARLSLLNPKSSDHDGTQPTRWAINMDCSFNSNSKFQKFKWRVTNKRSEFYANLPQDWASDLAYGSAWEFYNELTYTKWIGKACYRLDKREGASKMKLVNLSAIVMWTDGEQMFYRFWLENAAVDGVFNITSDSKFYMASSEPVRNFKPKGAQSIQL